MPNNLQHHINNPHFEQPHTPNLYSAPIHDNLPNYSPTLVPMPAPVMPQVPSYGTLVGPPELIPVNTLKEKPAIVECPHCQHLVLTVTDHEMGLLTGLSVVGFYMVGCHSGGCLLPFLFPWTKDVVHSCPACRAKIATFKRLGRDTQVHYGEPPGL